MSKSARNSVKHVTVEDRAFRELTNMKHRDLQRACIVRGMPSENVVNYGHQKLVMFFMEHYDTGQDESLLYMHDLWVEEQLKAKGYKEGDLLLSPALRFSYVGEIEKMDKPKSLKPNNVPRDVKKPKAEINQTTGVRSGTKKALTFDLTHAKKSITEIIEQVKKVFPDAEEKSIKIWHKKALKQM